MRRILLGFAALALAVPMMAQRAVDENGTTVHKYPTREKQAELLRGVAGAQAHGGGGRNLINHGGPVITSAKVVSIFWGSEWGTQQNPSSLANAMLGFFSQFGSTGEYNVITQYSGIQLTGLGQTYWVDANNPPTAVTDTMIHNEVIAYFNAGHPFDASTIYEVFLPTTSYSTSGGSSSCGGPNLQYCAYHGNFSYNGHDVKYSSMPYPSCGGCQVTGWSVDHNLDHFACHESREAVTDPDLNAWFDRQGNEADDKCAWSPSPFIGTNGYGYQWEWSNANGACVKTR
jgi:hypothetical protein